jgi:hypothetical protein
MNTNEKPTSTPSAIVTASAAAPPRRDKPARPTAALSRKERGDSVESIRIRPARRTAADKKSKVKSGLMSKMRCDSVWAGLTAEQRESLEGWLFEENLGYTEVLGRVQSTFGITASLMSLSRYYQRLAAERAQRELLDLKSAVAEIREIGVDRGELSAAVMSLLTKRLLKLLLESPDQVKEMAWLGHVLVGNEAQKIKRGWLAIGREKLDLEIARERAEDEAERQMMADANAEDDYAAEDAEVLKIRRHLFGTNLPE